MIKFIKNTAIIFITTVAVYFCIIYPQNIGNAVKEAVDRCLCVIVPSMFIFMCITVFISNTGIHSLIAIPFEFISEKLFRLPKEGFAIFLLSMISGYPTGIKLVSENHKNGNLTSEQASAMNNFCCCAGPAFISGTVAEFLYPDSNAGLLIFISVVSGNLVSALVLAGRLKKPYKSEKIHVSLKKNQLIPSVRTASSAMLQMCIMIAAFGGFTCILKLSGTVSLLSHFISEITEITISTAENIVLTFLEISNIVNLPPMQLNLFPLTAFLVSFGGLCVHMQISALADSNFSAVKFFLSRTFSASVSGITAYFLMTFLNVDLSCNVNFKTVSHNDYSPLPSLFLIIMICILIGSFEKNAKNSTKL